MASMTRYISEFVLHLNNSVWEHVIKFQAQTHIVHVAAAFLIDRVRRSVSLKLDAKLFDIWNP